MKSFASESSRTLNPLSCGCERHIGWLAVLKLLVLNYLINTYLIIGEETMREDIVN